MATPKTTLIYQFRSGALALATIVTACAPPSPSPPHMPTEYAPYAGTTPAAQTQPALPSPEQDRDYVNDPLCKRIGHADTSTPSRVFFGQLETEIARTDDGRSILAAATENTVYVCETDLPEGMQANYYNRHNVVRFERWNLPLAALSLNGIPQNIIDNLRATPADQRAERVVLAANALVLRHELVHFVQDEVLHYNPEYQMANGDVRFFTRTDAFGSSLLQEALADYQTFQWAQNMAANGDPFPMLVGVYAYQNWPRTLAAQGGLATGFAEPTFFFSNFFSPKNNVSAWHNHYANHFNRFYEASFAPNARAVTAERMSLLRAAPGQENIPEIPSALLENNFTLQAVPADIRTGLEARDWAFTPLRLMADIGTPESSQQALANLYQNLAVLTAETEANGARCSRIEAGIERCVMLEPDGRYSYSYHENGYIREQTNAAGQVIPGPA